MKLGAPTTHASHTVVLVFVGTACARPWALARATGTCAVYCMCGVHTDMGLCPHNDRSVPRFVPGPDTGVVTAYLLLHTCMRMFKLCVYTRVYKAQHTHSHVSRLCACAGTVVPCSTLAVAMGWRRWSGHLGNGAGAG